MKVFEKGVGKTFFKKFSPHKSVSYLLASSTATAQATVIPTIGLLPLTMEWHFSVLINFFRL